jgi:hypothetical protein
MHKDGIDLNLEIEEIDVLIQDATELTFESANNFIEITPNKLNLKDLINKKTKILGSKEGTVDYHLAEKKVNIKCTKGALTNHEEIKVFAKLGSKKEEVGKLMLYKNNIIPKAEIVAVNVILNGKSGSLRSDYEYLFKNQSFNQALIRAEVTTDTIFNIDNLPKTDKNVNDFIENYSSGSFLKNKNPDDYIKELINLYDTYGKHKPKSGLINTNLNKKTFLFYTSISHQQANGACSFHPNKNTSGETIGIDWGNAYVVFKSGSESKSAAIHECAHSLSLSHIFMEPNGKYKVSSPHVFYQGHTDNCMDYDWTMGANVIHKKTRKWRYTQGEANQNKAIMYSFFKWQWDIMRTDGSLIKVY